MNQTTYKLRNGDVIDNINLNKLSRFDIAELNRRINELNSDIEIIMDKITIEQKNPYNKQYGISSTIDRLNMKLIPLKSELEYLYKLREYTINHMDYKIETVEEHSFSETPLDIAIKNKKKENNFNGYYW